MVEEEQEGQHLRSRGLSQGHMAASLLPAEDGEEEEEHIQVTGNSVDAVAHHTLMATALQEDNDVGVVKAEITSPVYAGMFTMWKRKKKHWMKN